MDSINEKIFKAYDIRGLYPDELDENAAFKIGQAVADFFFPTQVVIGRDNRESSYPLFQAFASGVMKQGVDIVDIGICTSPMFYYVVASCDYEAGIMITASHNPLEYNGIKIVKKMAVPLGMGLGLENIRDMAIEGNFHKSAKQGVMKQSFMIDNYVKYLKSFQGDAPINHNLKMVLDSSGGPTGKIAQRVFDGKINIISLNFEATQDKSREPNPLKPEARKDAQDLVMAQRADGAFLWDGDGDRFFILDEKARLIPGHFVAAVLADYILKKHPGEKVVCDLRFSKAVLKTIERSGGTPILSRVGHSYIKNKMKEENAVFAAEMSGHYYFRSLNDFYSDNGIIPAMYLLEIMSRTGKKLSELFDPFTEKYFISEEMNFKVTNSQDVLRRLEEKFDLSAQTGKETKIIKLDGLTVEYPDWWFNVRPSNTEPVLRLVIEADTKEKLKEKIEFMTILLQSL